MTGQATATEGAAGTAPSDVPAGSGLELRNLTKLFSGHHGERVVAVDSINLHIDHGEYVVLLGPSGCGKTTTLRMIGGHETPTSGDVLLDGERLNDLAPDKRPTTTVFQHFALFPHKSVLGNVEFGLKMHGVGKEQRRQKALETLEMVGLEALADRKPGALSGGQQQRVALARVLVTDPKALLLDEPLGDVDRLLRLRMRVELRNLQRQTGLMFIHVTHDQEEALAVGDRIIVMYEGRIEQDGDPVTITTKPTNEIVAGFMGDNNILRGKITSRDGDRLVIETRDGRISAQASANDRALGSEAAVSVRAVAVDVGDDAGSSNEVNEMSCKIVFVEYLGDLVKLHLLSESGGNLLAKVSDDRYHALRDKEGSTVRLSWKEEDVRLLGG